MDWQINSAIVAAVLGSTGIAGTLTGGFQITRRARLRRSVEKSGDVLAKLAADSKARASLSSAVDQETLQLAALTLVSFPGDLRRLFRLLLALSGVYVGAVAIAVGYSEPTRATAVDPAAGRAAIGWLVGIIGLIFSIAMGLNSLLRKRRERFIELVTQGALPQDALADLGDRSAIVRVLDWITEIPFKIVELIARGALWLVRGALTVALGKAGQVKPASDGRVHVSS